MSDLSHEQLKLIVTKLAVLEEGLSILMKRYGYTLKDNVWVKIEEDWVNYE